MEADEGVRVRLPPHHCSSWKDLPLIALSFGFWFALITPFFGCNSSQTKSRLKNTCQSQFPFLFKLIYSVMF
jgi:hypothetical protein